MIVQLVSLSLTLLDAFPGPVVTFIDTRFYEDTLAMVSEARALIALFDQANIRRGRVLITVMSLPAFMLLSSDSAFR
jgi:transaldolase